MSNAGDPATAPDQIVEELTREVASGRYRAGQRFPTERELCARFGASRATIREAVSRLKHDGILMSRRGSGLYVIGSGQGNSFRLASGEASRPRDQAEIFELRMVMETAGAALAAERWREADRRSLQAAMDAMEAARDDRAAAVEADTSFHRAIAAATGNTHFGNFSRLLETGLRGNVELSYPSAEWGEALWLNNFMEHRAIHRAILARDPERARAAMLVHLNAAAEEAGLLPLLKRQADDTE